VLVDEAGLASVGPGTSAPLPARWQCLAEDDDVGLQRILCSDRRDRERKERCRGKREMKVPIVVPRDSNDLTEQVPGRACR